MQQQFAGSPQRRFRLVALNECNDHSHAHDVTHSMAVNPLPVGFLSVKPEAGQAAFTTELPLSFSWTIGSDDRVKGYQIMVSDGTPGTGTLLKQISDASQREAQIIDAEEVSSEALQVLSYSKVVFTIRAYGDDGAVLGGKSNDVVIVKPVVVVETGGADVFANTRGTAGGDDLGDDDDEEDELDLDDELTTGDSD